MWQRGEEMERIFLIYVNGCLEGLLILNGITGVLNGKTRKKEIAPYGKEYKFVDFIFLIL